MSAPGPSAPIPTLVSLGARLTRTDPPRLIVSALGRAPTSGWSDPRLCPAADATPAETSAEAPADGLPTFDFLARPPVGDVVQVPTPLHASHDGPAPAGLRGLRVRAASGALEFRFPPEGPALFEAPAEAGPAGMALIEPGDGFDELSGFDETVEETGFPVAPADSGCELALIGLDGMPEVRTEWETVCLIGPETACRLRGRRPVVWRRTCRLRLLARFGWPGTEDLRAILRDCAREAVEAGLLADALGPGGTAIAQPALTAWLKACLPRRGVALANEVSVHLRLIRTAGPWRRL